MKAILDELLARYAGALRDYLESGAEAALFQAYETGRKAVSERVGFLEMSAVHQLALVSVLLGPLPDDELARAALRASELAVESPVPFEMTARGTQETATVLQQINDVLEERNAEVRRALEELRQLQALKDDLVSLVVHDLQNPLSGLVGCLKLVKAAPGSAEETAKNREYLDAAQVSARRIGQLVRDVLDVRRMEEGALPLQRERVALRALAAQAAHALEGAARMGRVAVAVSGPEDMHLELDPKLIRRAVENLIANAIKLSPEGATVEVLIARTEGGAAIEVLDRGPGLPDGASERLFRKFGAVETNAGAERRGYGLGLYVVKLVAAAHGGAVTVRTREDGGAVFRVELPELRADPAAG